MTITRVVDCKAGFKTQHWAYTDNQSFRTPDGRCLDHGGKMMHVWHCFGNGSRFVSNQFWHLEDSGLIKSTTGLCLTVFPRPSHRNGGMLHARLARCDVNDTSQRWRYAAQAESPEAPPGKHRGGLGPAGRSSSRGP